MFFSRRFLPFFTTFSFGAFNDNMFRNALVIMISYQMDYSSTTGAALNFIAMGLLMLPYFPFSAIAGQAADKVDRRKMFIATKAAELILMILTLAAFAGKNVPLLMLLLFFMGTQSAVFSPLKYSYIPQMLPHNELLRGNAYVNAGTYIAIICGSITGNILIDSPNGRILTGSALVLCSIIGVIAAWLIPPTPPVNPQLKLNFNCFSATASLIKNCMKNSVSKHCILGLSGFWMAGALYMAQLAPFCSNILNAPPVMVLFFYLLFSIGVAAGSILSNLLNRFIPAMKTVPPALIIMAAFTCDIFFAASCIAAAPDGTPFAAFLRNPTFIRIAIDLLLLAVCGGLYSVPLNALLQRSAKKDNVARIVAGNNVVNSGAIALGTIAVAAMTKSGLISNTGVFIFIAAVNICTAIYLIPLRKIKF